MKTKAFKNCSTCLIHESDTPTTLIQIFKRNIKKQNLIKMPLTSMWLTSYAIISCLTIEQQSIIHQWVSGHCQYSPEPNQASYTVLLKSRNY